MKKNLLNVFNSSFFILAVSILLVLLVQACKSKSTDKPENDGSVEQVSYSQEELMIRGKEIAGQVNSTLLQALKKAIEEKGFEGSIEFCSGEAIPITDSIAQKEGVRIQRISHKSRNAQNKATGGDMEIIERFMQISQDTMAKKMPVLKMEEQGGTFYAPIYVANSLCLNCHGTINTDILPSVSKAIVAKYPLDQATGFKLNDFRGLLKIEF